MDFFKLGNSNDKIQMYSNPFAKDCIEQVYMFIRRDMFDRSKVNFVSTIEFINNNTKGTHRIEASNFNELVKLTETFIDSL